MSGLGQNQNTTTQTSMTEPWSKAAPYYEDILEKTKAQYDTGEGFSPFPGSTVVQPSSQTTQAMQGIEDLANQGNPLATASRDQALGILNSGGMSDWQRQALQGTHNVATGAQSIGTEGDYRDLMSRASNPYYEGLVDREAEKLGTDIQRNVDMLGRRGSGYNVNEIAQGVGDFRSRALSDNYNNTIANERGILGDITGVQGANIANQVGAGQGIFNAGNQAAGQVAQFAGLSPSIYGQGYAPFERLASVGAQNEDLAGRELQDQIDRYYMEQQAPWNALGQYSALASGAGQFGSSGSQTVQEPGNALGPLGGILSLLGLAGGIF